MPNITANRAITYANSQYYTQAHPVAVLAWESETITSDC